MPGAGGRGVVWRRAVPHHIRPRLALVSDRGQVVLFDDWTRSPGPFAVMLIDRDSRVVAQHSFGAVADALGVSRARLAAGAEHGAWMASIPRLSGDGSHAQVRAAGKTLLVDLAAGGLSVK